MVSRMLFDTRGKAQDIEDYLRPIITKRMEKSLDLDDFDPDSVIQSPLRTPSIMNSLPI